MMSRVEMLSNSRDSGSVRFLEFTRIVSRNKQKIAVFFEGEDEKYYSIRINTFVPELSWSGIKCGGKAKVLEMKTKIEHHPTYKNHRCIYFIDSDFDDNTEHLDANNVYVTPCYSIENLYISDACFIRILNAEFGINDCCEEHEDFETCLKLFKTQKEKYLNEISNFNYMIRDIRQKENDKKSKSKLNINNIDFDKVIKVSLDDVISCYDKNNAKSVFPDLASDIEIDFDVHNTFFADKCSETWFRGKQHLEFLRVFLTNIKTDTVFALLKLSLTVPFLLKIILLTLSANWKTSTIH